MLKLSGKVIPIHEDRNVTKRPVWRLLDKMPDRQEHLDRSALLVSESNFVPGFPVYLLLPSAPESLPLAGSTAIRLSEDFEYLRSEDVIALGMEDQRLSVLYRKASPHNSFLVTERCDNYCLMCSQPPKNIDDGWIIDEILAAIALIPKDAQEIGFTGGEPTLLGERLIEVLHSCKTLLPSTAVHVLSNGRRFSDFEFAKTWAAVDHFDLMVGIPVYSDISSIHDYVVQADGAFDQTLRGILNLKRLKQRVEIRVVLHRQTVGGLARLAQFIARNLLFVDHVALMGLEMMGFTRANLDALWIDPTEYQSELREAVSILHDAGLRTSIYNHQLCLLDRSLWPFAVRSISDWKNEYFEECNGCSVQADCGGFFSSAKFKRSDRIHAI